MNSLALMADGSLLDWLVRASWQAAVLAALVLLVQWLWGRHLSARWRYNLWALVLIRLLMPITPASPISLFNLLNWSSPPPTPATDLQATIRHPDDPRNLGQPPTPEEYAAIALATPPQPAPTATITPPIISSSPSSAAWPWRSIILAIWAAGVALLSLRILIASLRLSAAARRMQPVNDPALLDLLETCRQEMNLRQPVAMLASDQVLVPSLMGFWQPRLLLPVNLLHELDRRELRLVLLHELAHVRRRDVAVNWLATLLQTLHWFNPALWVAFARLRADRELACDELVLSVARGQERRVYGQTILKLLQALSRRAASPGMVGILEGTHLMRRRITMIAQFNDKRRSWSALALVPVLLLAAVALTDAAEPTAKPAARATPTTKPAQPGIQVRLETPGSLNPAAPAAGFGSTGMPDGFDPATGMPGMPGMAGMAGMAHMPLVPAVAMDPETAKRNAETEQLLKRTMPEVRCDQVALSEVVDFYKDSLGLNIFVDWKALEAAGIQPTTPVSLQLKNVRASEALRLALRSVSANLGYMIENGIVVITTLRPAAQPIIIRAYDVSDLIDVPADAQTTQSTQAELQAQLQQLQIQKEKLDRQFGQDASHNPDLERKFKDVLAEIASLQHRLMTLEARKSPARQPGQSRIAELAQLIQETVTAATWPEGMVYSGGGGGMGGGMAVGPMVPNRMIVIRPFNNKLIIAATEETHKTVEEVLAMLREKPATRPH